jgi:RHS repeat-associated protein
VAKFGYTGQRNLAAIGLMDYDARFYSPTLMRFLQPDMIVSSPENPQTWNRFSYVRNNPCRYSDPNGFSESPICYIYRYEKVYYGSSTYYRQVRYEVPCTTTSTPTYTPTIPNTASPTSTPTVPNTNTPTYTPTVTASATATATATGLATATQTYTPTMTATATFTPTPYGYISPSGDFSDVFNIFGDILDITEGILNGSNNNSIPVPKALGPVLDIAPAFFEPDLDVDQRVARGVVYGLEGGVTSWATVELAAYGCAAGASIGGPIGCVVGGGLAGLVVAMAGNKATDEINDILFPKYLDPILDDLFR